MSGFLITTILLNTKKDNRFFKNFYMRRALRIFPVYYLILIAFYIVVFSLDHQNRLAYYRSNAVYFLCT
ncbi:MAG: hypothetical protein C4330_10630 [Chitinophagaceae bacterium]